MNTSDLLSTRKTPPTIRFIFEHYAAGESSAFIVEQLNAAGLRTSKGNAFNKCSIPRIIQNEAYHGVYICKAYDVRIDGAIPAIIDDDLWKRAQKMLTLNKQHRAPHSSHADYLLSGKLFCGCCHSLMRGISGHNCRNDVYYYYACGNKADGGTCKKKKHPKKMLPRILWSMPSVKISFVQTLLKIWPTLLPLHSRQMSTSPIQSVQC